MPKSGCWAQRDMAGLFPNPDLALSPIDQYVGGMSLYGYVDSGPTNYVDPEGMWPIFPGPRPPVPPGYPRDPQDPFPQRRLFTASLTLHVTVAVGAAATYEGVQRALYDAAVERTRLYFDEMAKKGLMTAEQAARQFADERNALTIQFRSRTGPVGRAIAEALKPVNDFKTYETLREVKTDLQILARGGANQGVNFCGSCLRRAGGVCTAISLTITLTDIVVTPPAERPRKIVGHLGAIAGSLAEGWACGEVGLLIGAAIGGPFAEITAPVGAGIGFIFGSVFGVPMGEDIATKCYDAVVNE